MRERLTVTSNRDCARAMQLRARSEMRVSRVQRCAGKKFNLALALQVPFFFIV